MVFSSQETYNSPQNGIIIVDRFLWYTSIIVNSCLEAGQYLIDMWKNALRKLPKKMVPKNVLLLGLGGGNVIRLLQKKYPEVSITVIEWDEVMITIAKQCQLFEMTPRIKISHRDAREALETMTETFDLIIVDLFTGPTPPPFLGESATIIYLKNLLKQNGYLFVNVYRHVEYLKTFTEHLTMTETWKFRLNTLGLFTHPEESENSSLPVNFVDIRQSEVYLRGSFPGSHVVRTGDVLGVRQSKGLFAIEYYTSDQEPQLLPWRGFRFVIWDRVISDEQPVSWIRMLPGFGLSTVVVSDIASDVYWKKWSETARRYRTKWETQKEYDIVPVSRDDFCSIYMNHGRPKNSRESMIRNLDNRLRVNKESVSLFALRHIVTGTLVAGMGIIDAKDISHSYYLLAFMNKEIAPAQAGLWLINYWFKHCKDENMQFANFGPVWTPGQPKSWKGFTEFKSHFRPTTLAYKRPLFRFTLSLKKEPSLGE